VQSISRSLILGFIFSAALVAVRCGNNVPTEPSGTSNGSPRLDAISPAPLVQSDFAQNVGVAGSGFLSGLTLTVTDPTGAIDEVSGSRIGSVTTVNFAASVNLPRAGTYSAYVTNPGGVRSTTIQFSVIQANQTAPSISAVSPNPVPVSQTPVLVTITGERFDNTDVVHVVDPSGLATDYGATQVVVASSTLLQLSLVFNQRGTYQVSVSNGQGGTSGVIMIVAN
jgi:hypothetical protein